MRPRTAPIFVLGDRFPGANKSTRLGLCRLDLQRPQIRRFLSLATKAGYKLKSPVWFEDCFAHVGFPTFRVAFLMMNRQDEARAQKVGKLWQARGWKLVGVSLDSMEQHSDEDVTASMAAVLKDAKNGR